MSSAKSLTKTQKGPIVSMKPATPEKQAEPHTSARKPQSATSVARAACQLRASDDISTAASQARTMSSLQRTVGNTRISRMMGTMPVQAKLKVNRPNDPYEQEAEAVATQVASGRRPAQPDQEDEEELTQALPLRRTPEEEELAQADRAPSPGSKDVQEIEDRGLEGRIQSPGGGRPVPEGVRSAVESRTGYDFSAVRVHDAAQDQADAMRLNARAFARGPHVWLAPGQSSGDLGLMAHELTHVAQQGAAQRLSPARRQGEAVSRARDFGTAVHKTGEPRIQRGFFGKVWKGIKSAAGAVGKGIKSVGSAVWGGLKAVGGFTVKAAKAIGKWGWDVLKSAGAWVWDLATEAPIRIWRLLKHVGSGIVGTISWLWRGLKGALGHVWNGIKGIFNWASEGIVGLFSWIWKGIQGGAQWAWKLLKGDFSGFWDGIGNFFSWLGEGAVGLAKWGWNGLKAAAIWAWEGVKGIAKWLWEGIKSGAAWVGRLIAKLLDLIGFGEIMDLLWQIIKFNTRTLNGTEEKEARKVFADSISYWQVRIDEHSLIAWLGKVFTGSAGMGVTTFHTINFSRKITTAPGNSDMAWLIHELTHVAQMEHVGMQYIGEAIHAQATAGYGYTLAPGKRLREYNREQQGDIARDYYLALGTPTAATFPAQIIADLKTGNL